MYETSLFHTKKESTKQHAAHGRPYSPVLFLLNLVFLIAILSLSDLVILIMIFFRKSCSILVIIILSTVVVVFSFPQLQDSTLSTNPDWVATSSAVSVDGTNGNQESLIASGNLQEQNIWPDDSDLFSQPSGSDTNIPLDKSKVCSFFGPE